MDGGTAPAEEPEGPPPPPPVPPARYRITAPGPVSGGVMGVAFANGHAVVTDAVRHGRALDWFRAEPSYVVEEIDPPEPDPAPAAEPEPEPEDTPEDAAEAPAPGGDVPAPTARRRK